MIPGMPKDGKSVGRGTGYAMVGLAEEQPTCPWPLARGQLYPRLGRLGHGRLRLGLGWLRCRPSLGWFRHPLSWGTLQRKPSETKVRVRKSPGTSHPA
jgi:hypothetical protein